MTDVPARKYGTWRKRAKALQAQLELAESLLKEKTGLSSTEWYLFNFGILQSDRPDAVVISRCVR